LQESLVQDYDGLLRIGPAWPGTWDVDGAVYIPGGSKVDVQIRGGVPVTVAVEAGSTGTLNVANPWPGQQVEVLTSTGRRLLSTSADFTFPTRAGESYLIERVSAPTTAMPFAPVTGSPATAAKTLGTRAIGS